jgi:hypothetical protein
MKLMNTFSCQHDNLQHSWVTSIQLLQIKLKKYNPKVQHHLIQLLHLAVMKWKTTPHPIMPKFLHPTFHQMVHMQSQIGWDQIVYGRFSKSWAKAIEPVQIDTTNWISYTVRQIWNITYDVSKLRCDKNHGIDQLS